MGDERTRPRELIRFSGPILIAGVFALQSVCAAAPAQVEPLASLSFASTRDLLFTLVAAAYAHVEPKGVLSALPGRPGSWPAGKDPELMTRLSESLAAYLSKPSRPGKVTVGSAVLDVEDMLYKLYRNGSDPGSGVTWNKASSPQQMDVESATLGWAYYLASGRIQSRFTDAELANLKKYLADRATYTKKSNNWNLFYGVTNASLKRLGWPYHASAYTTCMNKSYQLYAGEGWYFDGTGRIFDDYNSHVFATHWAMWSILDGAADPERRKEIMKRLRRYLEDQPYFFAGSGAHPEFGRSTAYTSARLCALVMAYVIDRQYGKTWNLGFDVLPGSVSRGMLRRLIRTHLNHYIGNGAIGPDGLLSQRLTGKGTDEIAETYLSPGSVYWSVRTLGRLMLLDDADPLWSAEESPLPIETAGYNRFLATPGFLLSGDGNTGHVQLFNAGSTYDSWGRDIYMLKYSKFVYSSHFGYVTANDAGSWRNPDNMIQIGSNGRYGHRDVPGKFALRSSSGHTNTAVLAMDHKQVVDSKTFDVSTLIFVKDDCHVRVHRIKTAYAGTYTVREGGYALGLDAGAKATLITNASGRWLYRSGADGSVLVGALQGYNSLGADLVASEKRGAGSTKPAHTRQADYVLPHLATGAPVSGTQVFGILVAGRAKPFAADSLRASLLSFTADASGARIVFGDGTDLSGAFLGETTAATQLKLKRQKEAAAPNQSGPASAPGKVRKLYIPGIPALHAAAGEKGRTANGAAVHCQSRGTFAD